MNNMLPYPYNGKCHSQVVMQTLLSVAFTREPFPRSEGRGSIEAEEARVTYGTSRVSGVSTFGRTWLH